LPAAVDDPDPQPVAHRRRPLLEVRDQERRRQPDQLPAGEQGLDRAGQGGQHHAQHEHGVEHEEAVVAALAVQVAGGEGGDRPAQQERQDRERHRQPVEDQLHREVVVRDGDPLAQLDRLVPRPAEQHQGQDGQRRQQPGDVRRLARPPGGLLAEPAVQQGRHPEGAQQRKRGGDGEQPQ